MITPNTTIRFLKVPFSPSQNNLLKFDNVNSQIAYMESKIIYTMAGCTYQREGDGEYIRVNKEMDLLYNCNYVMFQNKNFSDKWFYAFIDKMEYLNPQVTKVFLKMDSYQTFQFDFSIQKTFIERQTFQTDYYNTLADTPSTGDLKKVWEYERPLTGLYFVLFNADPTVEDSTTSTSISYPVVGDYTIPCYMAVCTSPTSLSELVQAVSNKGRADRIQACYYAICPIDQILYTYVEQPKGDLTLTANAIYLVSQILVDAFSDDLTLTIPYTPTFKKELSYPYAKLEIVDRITGKSIELDLSKFDNPLSPSFTLRFNMTDNVEYKVIPRNYNGIDYSIENCLSVTPNTDLPIFSNSYAKYLKNNEMSNLLTNVMSFAGIVGSVSSGNVAGGISGFSSVASTIMADKVARSQPNQVTGLKGDTYEYVNNLPSIYFRLKVMDSDHMDIARSFWNAYGYPVRKITDYSNTSNKFNFIKTADCNIIADTIPSEYQKELEDIFNKGVTIWNTDYLQY